MKRNYLQSFVDTVKRLFLSASERLRHDFNALQRNINGAFGETQPLRHDLTQAEQNQQALETDLQAAQGERAQFITENPEAEAPNYTRKRTLMLYGPVLIESILGYKCISETLKVLNLSAGPIIYAILSVVLTLVFLSLAVAIRNLHLAYRKSGKHSLIDAILFLIPLLVLPVAAVATIKGTHNAQVQWVVGLLACVTFLINLAVARYSRVLQLHSALLIIDNRIARLQGRVNQAQKAVNGIRADMNSRLPLLIDMATRLQQMIQSFPTPPKEAEYSILLPYRFVMNRRIYFNDVLPIPSISITNPDGDVSKYGDFFDNAIGFNQNMRATEQPATEVEETAQPQLGGIPPFATSGNDVDDKY